MTLSYRLLLVAIAIIPTTLRAQPPPAAADLSSRYPAIPFQGDLDALLKQQLGRAGDRESIRRLLEDLQKEHGRVALPDDVWKLIDPANAARLDLLEPLIKDFALEKGLRGMAPTELERLKRRLEALVPGNAPQGTWPQPGNGPSPRSDPSGAATPFPNEAPAETMAAPVPSTEAQLREWARDLLVQVDSNQLGDWLRESPAWQETMEQVRKVDWTLDGRSDDWFSRLRGITWIENGWDALRSLPPPNLPRMNLPRLQIAGWTTPRWAAPSVGGAPVGSVSQAWLWLGLTGLAVLLAWFVWNYRRVRSHGVVAESGLGPWPVDPRQIATRSQLRLAFEYLTLLQLGEAARVWNHRRIAAALGERRGDRATSAGRLADLYERARYTPGPEELTAGEREQGRRDLESLLNHRA